MRRVIAAIEAGGVAARDIKTQHVGVQRSVRRHHPVSYIATNSVSVVVHAIRTTGAVIDAAVGAGATRVSGPSFWRSRTADLYQQALIAALHKARAKAQALAADSGATLGDVQSIIESGAQVQSLGDSNASIKAPSPSTPVQPGRSTVTADLTAVFAIA
jgi:uncharacterized protein YggE